VASGPAVDRCHRAARDISTRLTAQAVSRLVSERPFLRGGQPVDDGRVTLLSVDFHLTDQVVRLARSFRRYVDSTAPVIVVQNGHHGRNGDLRAAGLNVVGGGLNIGHGLALDLGMRRVQTEYVLISDPDAIVINPRFRTELISRLEQFGVCGIVISEQREHQRYHPICLAFETRLWKQGGWSLRDGNGFDRDVASELTDRLGGVDQDALLLRTRGGWNGVAWADCFSNTYGSSRIRGLSDDERLDGCPVRHLREYHDRWNDWAERVAAGDAGVADFPEPIPF
jgi:hypothetical protein